MKSVKNEVDTVSYEGPPAGVRVSLLKRRALGDGYGFGDLVLRGLEGVIGSLFDDVIEGRRRSDVLDELGGDDEIVER